MDIKQRRNTLENRCFSHDCHSIVQSSLLLDFVFSSIINFINRKCLKREKKLLLYEVVLINIDEQEHETEQIQVETKLLKYNDCLFICYHKKKNIIDLFVIIL